MLIPEISPEMFIRAIDMTVRANEDSVPPYGSGATLYIRPFAGHERALGVKPADEYVFRVFGSPVGAYFKGGVAFLTLTVSDFDRAAPHGTGDIKAGLNYAMSLYPGQLAARSLALPRTFIFGPGNAHEGRGDRRRKPYLYHAR